MFALPTNYITLLLILTEIALDKRYYQIIDQNAMKFERKMGQENAKGIMVQTIQSMTNTVTKHIVGI